MSEEGKHDLAVRRAWATALKDIQAIWPSYDRGKLSIAWKHWKQEGLPLRLINQAVKKHISGSVYEPKPANLIAEAQSLLKEKTSYKKEGRKESIPLDSPIAKMGLGLAFYALATKTEEGDVESRGTLKAAWVPHRS